METESLTRGETEGTRGETRSNAPNGVEPVDGAFARPRSDGAFALAEKRSRTVRRLKVILPTIGVLIILGGIGATWVARAIPENVAIEGLTIDNGRVVMEDPRMSGVDANDRPYELVAERAMQALNGGAIDLEAIDAKVSVSDTTTAHITAASGHYEPNAQTLGLDGGLSIKTNDGLKVDMRQAEIDLAEGVLVSQQPVTIQNGEQSIRANALTVSDNGKRIRFSGGVTMSLKPNSSPNSSAPSAKREAALELRPASANTILSRE
ncbi:MAG: LPS export ABC transporter periplasmic protein LptC [Pseudomonadota bacterium]|nr:LPS export ABC transporter periplasmic protein LptC [Pseudomonadota bacterium]